MLHTIFTYEPSIRLGAFSGIFVAMAVWELFRPRRTQKVQRRVRWPANLGVVAIDTLLVRLVFPTTAVGLSLVAEAHGWGLFKALTPPVWVAVVSAVILLDLTIYFQHVLFHAVPAQWRLHRMHHA
jgi:sterol desaturase/sphingolipid hydroxylase (fatty acid hydroxylase superfamily)